MPAPDPTIGERPAGRTVAGAAGSHGYTRAFRMDTAAGDRAATGYEQRFAALFGEEAAAFAFWKGRVALYAILRALGIGPGDEVVLPGFTCVVVPNMIRCAGAVPVYVDIAPGGLNIDPERAEAAVTPRTRAILVQHTFGVPAAVDEVGDLARRRGLRLVEDCAHVMAGADRGGTLGTLGDAAFFSSQWSKPYTTGLGGMALTRDPELAARLREVRRGFEPPPRGARIRLAAQYQSYRRLFTPRLAWRAQEVLRIAARAGLFVGSSVPEELEGDAPPDLNWLMAGAQHRHGERLVATLPARAAHARMLAGRYDDRLRVGGWRPPNAGAGEPLLRYPVLVGDKDGLLAAAHRARVELGSWFETPLHPVAMEIHRRFGYIPGACPRAEAAARAIVNLPLHPRVSAPEADRIARFVLRRAVPAPS